MRGRMAPGLITGGLFFFRHVLPAGGTVSYGRRGPTRHLPPAPRLIAGPEGGGLQFLAPWASATDLLVVEGILADQRFGGHPPPPAFPAFHLVIFFFHILLFSLDITPKMPQVDSGEEERTQYPSGFQGGIVEIQGKLSSPGLT